MRTDLIEEENKNYDDEVTYDDEVKLDNPEQDDWSLDRVFCPKPEIVDGSRTDRYGTGLSSRPMMMLVNG